MLKKKSVMMLVMSAVIFAGALSGGSAAVLAAETQQNGVKVIVDGNPVSFSQNPITVNGGQMVSVKETAEAAGWQYTEASPTLITIRKNAEYTDGSRKYPFSSHVTYIDLERGRIDRSVTVGLGGFFDTPGDHNISFSVPPIITNGSVLLSIEDMEVCLYAAGEWDEATETVTVTSGELPYYDGNGLENRQGLFEEMRTHYQIAGELVKTGEQPAQISQPETQSDSASGQPQTAAELEYFYENGKRYAYINGLKTYIADEDEPNAVQIDYYDPASDPLSKIKGPFQ